MTCLWCETEYADGPPECFASPPECAFKTDTFSSANWNCAGLQELRHWLYEHERTHVFWESDQKLGVIPLDDHAAFIVVSYYKNRGRTEGVWVVESDRVRPFTLNDLTTFLQTQGATP